MACLPRAPQRAGPVPQATRVQPLPHAGDPFAVRQGRIIVVAGAANHDADAGPDVGMGAFNLSGDRHLHGRIKRLAWPAIRQGPQG